MLNVRIEIKGHKKIIEQLKNTKESFKDWRPELEAVGKFLKDFYQDPVFETEGGIFGARWSPLSQPYHSQKATIWPGRGILEASGTMRRSYETRVFSNLLQLINPTEYAVYHQFGTGRLPARLLIKVDDKVKSQAIDVFKKGALIKLQNAIR